MPMPTPLPESPLYAAAAKLALVSCRTGALFSVYPLGNEVVPMQVRAAAALVLALALAPAVPARSDGNFLLQLVAEGAVGLLSALLARVPLAAVEAGVQISSVGAGLGIVSLLNPATEDEVHALTELLSFAALVIFFAVSGHHQLILALHHSFTAVPPGAAGLGHASVGMIVRLGTEMFSLAVQVAAPVTLLALAVNLAIALVAKAAPALNIFSVTLSALLLLGLLMILRGLPAFGLLVTRAAHATADHFLWGYPAP